MGFYGVKQKQKHISYFIVEIIPCESFQILPVRQNR